jgi:hypothetical protein
MFRQPQTAQQYNIEQHGLPVEATANIPKQKPKKSIYKKTLNFLNRRLFSNPPKATQVDRINEHTYDISGNPIEVHEVIPFEGQTEEEIERQIELEERNMRRWERTQREEEAAREARNRRERNSARHVNSRNPFFLELPYHEMSFGPSNTRRNKRSNKRSKKRNNRKTKRRQY